MQPFPVPPDEIPVGGDWQRGAGPTSACVDPADGEVIATVHAADPAQVDAAARAGAGAAVDPAWRDLLPHQRAHMLDRVADAIEHHAEQLALLQTRNTGKTLGETRALVASAAGTFRYYSAALETLEGELPPSRGAHLTMSVHEPIGVVGAITPWNSPIASDAQKIAPALAAGNAVLLKPAEATPLVSLALARLAHDAGVPPALLSVLPGPGAVVGDAIARHPLVGKLAFTGGTTTGRVLGRIAAERIIPVTMELGGKSPTIVCEDADVDEAVAGILYGIFSSTGQSCVAGSRIFLPRKRYEELAQRLVAGATALRVGPGTDPATRIGPLATFAHRDKVAAMVDRAREEGARIRCGGTIPDEARLARGAFYPPTLLDGLAPDAKTCQEEIFGPVGVLLPYDDEDDLVTQANATVYGLACGIWTADYRRALRLARRIEAGTVWINTYKQFSISTPFSGVKDSGLGADKGRAAIRGYQRQKSLYLNLATEPIAWAGA
ncbi:aldehyde dehydrogenase family protein [Amycolatopsis sp. K13G38]|uniref:Aldehyde dehydrogenase family protein n=1 Tax=Amycolatopsis acididurans TaxID=2724524 RepID=A0ABX1JFT4_9PSEU|nr:aldehyde dehydrogenase family protein [Amycolatopsis acididurans]NKQ57620.1 aldehyde dehydrogenase family protein [Amycolatopsis acididurans]